MTLIPNAAQAYKFASVIAAVLLAAFNLVQANFDAIQAVVPPGWMPYINAVWGAIIVLLRVLKQQGLVLDVNLPPAPSPVKGS